MRWKNVFSPPPPADVKALLDEYKQGHLLNSWRSLSASQREDLLEDIRSVDFPRLFGHILPKAVSMSTSSEEVSKTYSPFPLDSLCRAPTEKQKAAFKKVSSNVVSSNKVACVLLAGGQGTRLGYKGCKGSFVIDRSRNWSLFDYIVKRAKKQGTRSWWIMTSPMNHQETISYFKSKDYYGLGASSFNFFSQGVLPCLKPPPVVNSSSGLLVACEPTDYKIILSSPSSVSFAPDGNGGVYNSLSSSGMLSKMADEGVVAVHCFSVDNVLVKPADPAFVGFCMSIGADVGNKVSG